MTDLDQHLADAFEHLAEQAPRHPDLAGVVRERARHGRRVTGAVAAAVAAVIAGTGAFLIRPEPAPSVPVADSACASTVTRAVLPEWARTGFSDPEPVMPFVTSASGNIVAILFADGLASPPRPDAANKVLWVWRTAPAGTIRLSARLDGTGPAVTSGLPSPFGPSYVDLPAPGCWRLTFSWAGGQDTMDLQAISPR